MAKKLFRMLIMKRAQSLCSPKERRNFDRNIANAKRAQSSSPAETLRPANKNSQLERRRILNEVVEAAQPPGRKEESGVGGAESSGVSQEQKDLTEMADQAKQFCVNEMLAKAAEGHVCYEYFSESASSACHSMREARKKKRAARNYDEQDEIDAAELRAMHLLDEKEFFFPNGISASDLQEFCYPTDEPKFGRNDHVDVFDDGKFWEARVEHRRPMTYGEVICRERDGTDFEKSGGGPWVYYVALLEIQGKKDFDHIAYSEFELRPSGPQRRERLTNVKVDRNLRMACRTESVIQFKDVLWAVGQNDPSCGRMLLVRRESDGEWKQAIIQYVAVERVMNIGTGDDERPSVQAGVKDSELKDMDSHRIELGSAELDHEPDILSAELALACHGKTELPRRLRGDRITRGSRSHSNTSRSSVATQSPPPSRIVPPIRAAGKNRVLRGKSELSQAMRNKIKIMESARKRGQGGRGGRRGRGRGGARKGETPFSIPNLARNEDPVTKNSTKGDSENSEISVTEKTNSIKSLRDEAKNGGEESGGRPLSAACDIVTGEIPCDDVGMGAVEIPEKPTMVSRQQRVNAMMRSAILGTSDTPRLERTAKELAVLHKLDKLRQNMHMKQQQKSAQKAKENAKRVLGKGPKGGKGSAPVVKTAAERKSGKWKRKPPKKDLDSEEECAPSREVARKKEQGVRKDQEWELPLPKSRQGRDEKNNAPPITEVMPATPGIDFCWDRRALDEISKTLGGIHTLSMDASQRLAVLEKRVGKTDLVKVAKEVDLLMQFVRKTNGDVTKMHNVQQDTLAAILTVTESLSSSSTKSPMSDSSVSPLLRPLPKTPSILKTPSIHFTPRKDSTISDDRPALLQKAEKVLKESPLGVQKTPESMKRKKGNTQAVVNEKTPKGSAPRGGDKRGKPPSESNASRNLDRPKATGGATRQAASGGGGGGDGDDSNESDDDKNKRRKKAESDRVPLSKEPASSDNNGSDENQEVPETEEENNKGEESEEKTEKTPPNVPTTPGKVAPQSPLSSSAVSSSDDEVKALEQKLSDDKARLHQVETENRAAEKAKRESEQQAAKEERKQKKIMQLKLAASQVQKQLAAANRKSRELSSSAHSGRSTDVEEKKKMTAKKKKRPASPSGTIDLGTEFSPPGTKRIRRGRDLPTSSGDSSDEEGEEDGGKEQKVDKPAKKKTEREMSPASMEKYAASIQPPLPQHLSHPIPPDLFRPDNELGFWVRKSADLEEKSVPVAVRQISDWADENYQAAIGHCRAGTSMQGKDDFNAFQVAGKPGTEHADEVPIVTGVKNELPFYAGGWEQLEEVSLRDPIRYVSQQRWERLQKGKIPEVNKAKNPGGQAYVLFRTMLQEDPNWHELLLLDENHVRWSRKFSCVADVYSNQPRLFSEFFRLFLLAAGFKHLDRPFKDGPAKTKAWCKAFAQTWNKYRLNDKVSPAEMAKIMKSGSKGVEGDEEGETSESSSEDSSDQESSSEDTSEQPGPSTKKKKKMLKKKWERDTCVRKSAPPTPPLKSSGVKPTPKPTIPKSTTPKVSMEPTPKFTGSGGKVPSVVTPKLGSSKKKSKEEKFTKEKEAQKEKPPKEKEKPPKEKEKALKEKEKPPKEKEKPPKEKEKAPKEKEKPYVVKEKKGKKKD